MAIAWIVVALSVTGCNRGSIRGVVVDVQGQALPGVVVRQLESETQALTNVRGEYRIPVAARAVTLEFDKTGYTTGRLEIPPAGKGRKRATTVQLWRLPVDPGVYVYERHRYRAADKILPQPYRMLDDSTTHGFKRLPNCEATAGLPLIVCFKTPRYDARLTRLNIAQAKIGASSEESFEVYAPGGTSPVELEPIDLAKKQLLRLRIDQPLEPGIYAVHWGALSGYTTLDNRVYAFRIEPPPEELAVEEGAVGEASAGAASESEGGESETGESEPGETGEAETGPEPEPGTETPEEQ